MSKHKWQSKLVSLTVAFALVFSLVGIAIAPMAADNRFELEVDAWTENTTYCCCDNFTVYIEILVPAGAPNAINVTGTVSVSPDCAMEQIEPEPPWGSFNVTEGEPEIVEKYMHCLQPGLAVITVTVWAEPPYDEPVSDQWWIEQESADLVVHIFEPVWDDAIMECSTFNLTFNIANVGCRAALGVVAQITPDAKCEVDELGGGVAWRTPPLSKLDEGKSHNYTVLMHCIEEGESWIHVDVVAAMDDCTGKQMDELFWESDMVRIVQYEELVVECDADPHLTKTCYNVSFTANATGGIPGYTWEWDFDEDGLIDSTNKDDIWHYKDAGFYNATVTVTDSRGNTADCSTPVEVRDHPSIIECWADPDPTKVCHNTTFNATAEDGIEPYIWWWDFDDGTPEVGPLDAPATTHHYNVTGTYNVTVRLLDSWENPASCNFTLEVKDHPSIIECWADPDPTKIGYNTTFDATVSEGVPPFQWWWDFGDSSPEVGPLADPTTYHTYTTPGTYNVSVRLLDSLDNPASCNFTLEVKEEPSIIDCWADPDPTKVCHNTTFNATATGGIPPYTWWWDFDGDGSDDTCPLSDPATTHHYSVNGTYNVSVRLVDKLGNPASCNFTLEVYPKLEVDCDAEPEIVHVCHNVTFTAWRFGGIPGNPYTWEWDFGDGTGSTSAANVTHAYMCVGNYTATVTLTDEDLGNTANCTAEVTVFIEAPELISPPNMHQLTSKNVTFEWEDIGCCNYTLQVWQKEADGQKVWLVQAGHENSWTLPVFNGEWRWQVTATDSCNVSATSDTWFFRVDQPGPSVTVMSPNGGEVWQSGDSHAITWTAAPTDGVIDIYYSSDNGENWILIKGGEENDGAYAWTVPSVGSDQCLVRVIVSDSASGSAQDTSDDVFTITTDLTDPTVTVISPNGGESYAGGSTQNITWTASDNVAVTSIDLYFSSNGGAEWAVIAVGEANDGTYAWTVPGINSDQCLVKVRAFDAAGNVGSDISNSVFSISTDEEYPDVTVNYPNGGETFLGGSQETITWHATESPFRAAQGGFEATQHDLLIDIYYSSDGGGSWTNIIMDEENDGAYPWDVPEINSDQCLVRVDATDEVGNTGTDTSDSVFTIMTAPSPVTTIDLEVDWNLVSLPLIPDDSDIDAVLTGIAGNVTNIDTIYYYDASNYYGLGVTWLWWNGSPASTLTTLEDGFGYWFDMNTADTLTVTGSEMPEPPALPPTYDVVAGWNMIGFKSTMPMSHGAYLMSISGDYSVLYGYDAAAGAWFNVFPLEQHGGMVEPGYGYWIWMDNAGTIVP